jgi:hypothetical protein
MKILSGWDFFLVVHVKEVGLDGYGVAGFLGVLEWGGCVFFGVPFFPAVTTCRADS